jgi:hypothetical protein
VKVSCGVNGEPWTDENPLFLCHHCGMPVCLRHGKIIGSDEVFAASEEADYRAAMHCPTCARDHPGGKRAYSGSWIDPRMKEEAVRENSKWNVAAQARAKSS